MRITNTGNVGIGTTSPSTKLSVAGTVGFSGLTASVGAGSLCLSANNEVVFNSGSDNCLSSTRNTKHDITPLSLDAVDILNALEPVSFIYNGTDRVRYGFIAETTASIDEMLATYNAEGDVTGIDDRSILSVLVRAFQEFYGFVMSRFEAQDERIEALEARIQELEAREGIEGPQPEEESTPEEESDNEEPETESPPAESNDTDEEIIEETPDKNITEDPVVDEVVEEEIEEEPEITEPVQEEVVEEEVAEEPIETPVTDTPEA
ncbi:MAG: hypothetical protein COU10_03955 [Candidatus Harrisonbacteria bacterium CG10_big_fil_rev_8_21_14_0_10_45_28]|uniref:Peptidase S74 domain-containing protein n=1 Tax=Candidatus Harrisonbacteria bacterium CG10_big_fil_rev_8_21_14_0_10_45_28 TaxID=1974586 RepID=A0A2H0UP69_9BACT|nr:MAG: hypothetical protein COU10_03955 [Candidatus Harrisonbacteria bacterium CG10_big_fil_rev_8_21_14_0_10_45_28]